MKPMTFTIILLSFCLIGTAQVTDSTYTNPITEVSHIGDPFIFQDGDTYYLYATSNTVVNRGFFVWTSKNLVQWDRHWLALDNTVASNEWGKSDFWAPEVFKLGQNYYMVYSARAADGKLKLALAKSDDPLGPFVNFKAPLLDSSLVCIDGDFFMDDDGKLYLYYVKDCSENIINGRHVSQIYVQEMMPYSFYQIGEPVLCVEPSQGWEHPNGDWSWNEGPYMIKHEGLYYLMYSANYFASVDYSIGYATATSPKGPWSKYSGNPILKADLAIGVSGPGHNSAAYSPDGKELFVAYHTHTDPNNPSGDRILNIDRMYFENGLLKIMGPTRTPQPLPSGATISSVEDNSEQGYLDSYDLFKCYPNPFNDRLIIEFQAPESAKVKIQILDLGGQIIKTLFSGTSSKTKLRLIWNGKDYKGHNVSSGIYFCRLKIGNMSKIEKISFIK